MQLNKHGSFYIRNGWPTKIIDAVEESAVIFSPNNELAAVDQIGVGRVMIKSMRYWGTVTGITREQKEQHGVTQRLTELGEDVRGYDPYCQARGTLWLIHRNLARAEDEATAWWWAFNEYIPKVFSKETFTEAFYAYLKKQGEKYIRKTVDREFDCLKNTYVSEKSFDAHKVIDEDTIPFLAPLNLIEYLGNSQYEKRKVKARDIPLDILLYCILEDNSDTLRENAQIDLDKLLQGEKQVGRYMNLSYSVLLELLQQLENRKKLTLVNNFGSRYIQLVDNNPSMVLTEYYAGIAR